MASDVRGPLPPNWEIAYSEVGEKYFIDHNTGTTQWTDPRDEKRNGHSVSENGHDDEGVGVDDETEDELPEGWERVDDETHGTFYVDHVNKKTQYERPEPFHRNGNGYAHTGVTTTPPEPLQPAPLHHGYPGTSNGYPNGFSAPSNGQNGHSSIQNGYPAENYASIRPNHNSHNRPHLHPNGFTTDPANLRGELITTRIIKGPKGLGFTLIGNDGGNSQPEFIQIKSIIPNGPAALDKVLHTGDVLVYVDNECMLGASQDDACRALRSISVNEAVTLQICRGYPLILDPTNRIYAENVYGTGMWNSRTHERLEIEITKGPKGFGFTITDSPQGQRVKSVLYPDQCPNLLEGDLIVEVDGQAAQNAAHLQLVQMLQEFPVGYRCVLLVARQSVRTRSRTPMAGFRFGERQRSTPLPVQAPRSKTPAPNNKSSTFRQHNNTTMPRNYERSDIYEELSKLRPPSRPAAAGFSSTPNYVPATALAPSLDPNYQLVTVNLIRTAEGFGFRLLGGVEMGTPLQVGAIIKNGAAHLDGRLREGDEICEIDNRHVVDGRHDAAVSLIQRAATLGHVKLVVRRLKDSWSSMINYPTTNGYHPNDGDAASLRHSSHTYDVHLSKTDLEDFGCTIITIDQRFIGKVLPNSPAEQCRRLKAGDCVVAINGMPIHSMTHQQVIGYIKSSGNNITFTIDPTKHMPNYVSTQQQPNDDYGYGTNSPMYLAHSKPMNGSHSPISNENVNGNGLQYLNQGEKDYKLIVAELSKGARGFGFSIRGGHEFERMPLFILRIAEDGPAAEDGSLRVGDQLIEINGESTAGMTHSRAIALIREQATVRLVVRRPRSP